MIDEKSVVASAHAQINNGPDGKSRFIEFFGYEADIDASVIVKITLHDQGRLDYGMPWQANAKVTHAGNAGGQGALSNPAGDNAALDVSARCDSHFSRY